MEQNNKTGAICPGYSDRKLGNIGTASESNPVTAHGIFNNIVVAQKDKTLVMNHINQFYDCYEIGTIETGSSKVKFFAEVHCFFENGQIIRTNVIFA